MGIVLIVEDDAFICELVEIAIQERGHHTFRAGDVDEALAVLRSPQQIDVLFTDIYLKTVVYGGCDVAREAIVLRPELQVIYATGNALTETMKALFVKGARCLRKPYSDGQLHDAVDNLLAARAQKS